MRKTACESCNNNDVPLNDAIKIDGKVYCSNCFSADFPEERHLHGKTIEKKLDPTVCSSCNKDFDTTELSTIGIYPHCQECETKVRNRTFPNWVKGFFIGVILIVIFSFFWNWKYFDAYLKIKNSTASSQKGDYLNAYKLMETASNEVPEIPDLKTLSIYYKGIDLLSKDKNEEALVEFNKCKNEVPENYDINQLIAHAKIGSSFNKKDYEGFLAAAKELLATDSTSAGSYSSVASAYACIYADKGNESDKLLAIKNIDKAKSMDSTSVESKFYYNFLAYRIYSRQIITREEFIKKYPNGWTKN